MVQRKMHQEPLKCEGKGRRRKKKKKNNNKNKRDTSNLHGFFYLFGQSINQSVNLNVIEKWVRNK